MDTNNSANFRRTTVLKTNSTDTVIQIFKTIQSVFPDCNYQSQDNLIWVRRGSVLLHILEFNTLEYYFETKQLTQHLEQLKK